MYTDLSLLALFANNIALVLVPRPALSVRPILNEAGQVGPWWKVNVPYQRTADVNLVKGAVVVVVVVVVIVIAGAAATFAIGLLPKHQIHEAVALVQNAAEAAAGLELDGHDDTAQMPEEGSEGGWPFGTLRLLLVSSSRAAAGGTSRGR